MAAPTFDASSAGDQAGGILSVGHTIAASGNDRFLLVFFFGAAGSNAATKFTNVQYNGVAPDGQLTPDEEENEFSNFFSISAYYWLESSLPGISGAYNITANAAGGQWNGGCVAMSFTGAKQSAPTDSGRNSSNVGTPASSTVSITVTSADEVVADSSFAWGTSSLGASTPTAGQTEPSPSQTTGTSGSYRLAEAYEVTGVGAQNQTWSFTANANLFCAMAFGIESSGVAPAAAPNTFFARTP
jgi:hypothetical protein